MKKGQIMSGCVASMDFPNKGIVNTEEGAVTVKNALPGQTISFQVNKKHSGHFEGRLLSVEAEGPDCYEADDCANAGICGGCLYQKRRYETTTAIKEAQIKKLLDGAVKGHPQSEEYTFEGIIPSPRFMGYRNKMEFSFGDEYKDGPLALGLHKRNSMYDIVNSEGCHIATDAMNAVRKATLDFFAGYQVPYYHKMRHEGYLRHLLVRHSVAYDEVMVALVTSDQKEMLPVDETELLKAYAETILHCLPKGATAQITGILHMVNTRIADIVAADSIDVLYGRDYIREELLGLQFKITPFSFFQTNSKGAEMLYSKVREYVMDSFQPLEGENHEKVVFDLYSGTGTIAQIIAPVADRVIGVEIVEEAVAAATENAAANGLGGKCHFIAGDVLKTLDDIEERPDYIILDPPREGIHPKALPKILQYGVEHIVYISCKATSLVEDLVTIHAYGYSVVKACAVDMFPYTGGIETVVLLRKDGE